MAHGQYVCASDVLQAADRSVKLLGGAVGAGKAIPIDDFILKVAPKEKPTDEYMHYWKSAIKQAFRKLRQKRIGLQDDLWCFPMTIRLEGEWCWFIPNSMSDVRRFEISVNKGIAGLVKVKRLATKYVSEKHYMKHNWRLSDGGKRKSKQ